MIINHNLAALNTNRQLSINSTATSKSLQKLSSGLRINSAADDAAGLAISEKMKGQINGLTQASSNSQNAISMIQTGEGALSETQSILQRMKELATQAANGTNTTSDTAEIQKEMNQLSSEINRIGNTTEFNTQKLLNGNTTSVTVTPTTSPSFGSAVGAVGTVATTTAYSATGSSAVAASLLLDGVTFTAASSGIVGNGYSVTITQASASGTTTAGVVDASGNLTITLGTNATGSALAVTASDIAGLTFTGAGAALVTATATTPATAVVVTAKTDLAGGAAATSSTAAVFNFNVTKNFAAGDQVTIGSDTYTFGSGSGQVAVGGNASISVTNLRTAISSGATYTASGSGTNVILTQKTAASGAAPTVSVAGSGVVTPGVYEFGTGTVAAGGSYTIDKQEIKVVDDATDAGIANGTSILAGADATEQRTNLVAAIALNAGLTGYTAAVSSTTPANIQLTQGTASATAPVVSTSTKAGSAGKFASTFQVGANSGQSMTINISDMRSLALGISGDGTTATKTAANGYTASYTTTADVSDGTTNTNTEYALDVSTYDKATAAIGVLDDAISAVSAQRSQLGAYQNRLEHTINNLGTATENMASAESTITDVDMASEMSTFTKNNILTQAATAMLAQANQQPQTVLSLLK